MHVLIEQSVCSDCLGLSTCMKLKRLNSDAPGKSISDTLINLYDGVDVGKPSDVPLYRKRGRPADILEGVITNCSMKNKYNERLMMGRKDVEENSMYYCPKCQCMHKRLSTIGRQHKEKANLKIL